MGDMMGLDIAIAAASAICAVLLLTGRGAFILRSFRNKADQGQPLPYEEKKYSIAMGICCIPVCLSSLIMIFLSEYTVLIIASMVVTILIWAGAIFYLKKYAKVEPPKNTINKKVKELQRKK